MNTAADAECGGLIDGLIKRGIKMSRGRLPQHGDCMNGTSGPIYRLWSRIKERCSNPNKDNWHRYGGRGIRVCEEWLGDYDAFKSWAIGAGFQKGLQIDRINSDGNYEPSNCRFVSPAENTRNQEQVKLTVKKVLEIKKLISCGMPLKDIAPLYGVNQSLISMIKSGKRWADVC